MAYNSREYFKSCLAGFIDNAIRYLSVGGEHGMARSVFQVDFVHLFYQRNQFGASGVLFHVAPKLRSQR